MDKIHGSAALVCKAKRKTTIKATGIHKDAMVSVEPQYTGSTAARISFSIDGANVMIIVNAGTLMEQLKKILTTNAKS